MDAFQIQTIIRGLGWLIGNRKSIASKSREVILTPILRQIWSAESSFGLPNIREA